MKIICLDDKNRPKEIPENFWVKEGEWYTPLVICKMALQDMILGVIIQEIDLSLLEDSPYLYFRLNRFGIPEEDIAELLEIMENSKDFAELDSLKIQEIFQNQEMEVI
jgi:hypothetical protein